MHAATQSQGTHEGLLICAFEGALDSGFGEPGGFENPLGSE
jgi:hypothetical protein